MRRAAVVAGTAAIVGAGVAAARRPEARSVISRVVEQVKDRASTLGSSPGTKMPGSSGTTTPSGGGTQSSWGTGGSSGSNYGDEDEM